MPNRRLLTIALVLATSIALAQSPSPQSFDLDEATIAELQQKMQSGRETARSLVEKYLARIASIDRGGPALRSVLETNPDALTIADQLDAERRARGARGPLHGIPILLKDNIATADKMMTSAGSLALAGVTPPKDAFVASRLRAAGAVILGRRISASGRTSDRPTPRAAGADAVGRRRTPMRSIATHRVPARDQAPPSPRISPRLP